MSKWIVFTHYISKILTVPMASASEVIKREWYSLRTKKPWKTFTDSIAAWNIFTICLCRYRYNVWYIHQASATSAETAWKIFTDNLYPASRVGHAYHDKTLVNIVRFLFAEGRILYTIHSKSAATRCGYLHARQARWRVRSGEDKTAAMLRRILCLCHLSARIRLCGPCWNIFSFVL